MTSLQLDPVIADAVIDLLRPVVTELVDERFTQLQAMQSAKRWLTLPEAAERLGCSVDAVRMRARRGRLEYRRQGRRFYVSAAGIDEL